MPARDNRASHSLRAVCQCDGKDDAFGNEPVMSWITRLGMIVDLGGLLLASCCEEPAACCDRCWCSSSSISDGRMRLFQWNSLIARAMYIISTSLYKIHVMGRSSMIRTYNRRMNRQLMRPILHGWKETAAIAGQGCGFPGFSFLYTEWQQNFRAQRKRSRENHQEVLFGSCCGAWHQQSNTHTTRTGVNMELKKATA